MYEMILQPILPCGQGPNSVFVVEFTIESWNSELDGQDPKSAESGNDLFRHRVSMTEDALCTLTPLWYY